MAKIIQYRKSTQYLILKWYCFCIGDITEKGYFKKMEQLKKSTECELKSTTPIDAAVDLKKGIEGPGVERTPRKAFWQADIVIKYK